MQKETTSQSQQGQKPKHEKLPSRTVDLPNGQVLRKGLPKDFKPIVSQALKDKINAM